MKKISQGKYEIFTTKKDAIDKFMQMQGFCREKISGEHSICFYCSKKGKITITDPPHRPSYVENTISTYLFAEIIEQDGKTYAAYYTVFSKFSNVLKLIALAIDIIMTIFGIIFFIINLNITAAYLTVLVIGLTFFILLLFTSTKDEKNSPNDSEILIKELENRVDAVNLWGK